MEEGEEDYWTASSVKKNRSKQNIFDDNVTVEAASDLAKYRKSLSTPDEEDVETIGWDDTPVPSKTDMTSTRPQAAVSSKPQAAVPYIGVSRTSLDPATSHPTSKPPTSSMTHNRSRSDVLVGSMGKMSLTKSPSVPDPGLSTYMTGGMSTSVSVDTSIASMVGKSEFKPGSGRQKTRQEEEIEYLREQLQMALRSAGTAPVTVKDTVKRIVKGEPYALASFKSKEDKLALLDTAIKTHEGNAIIAAVIHLKRTIKDQIFNLELRKRPEAVDQYLVYLRSHYNLKELEDVLGMLGRTEEVAMLKLKQAVSVSDPVAKIDRLKSCLGAHFKHYASLEHDASLIEQQIDLLHRQRPVEVADDMAQKEGKHMVFRKLPRAASIINMPVVTTLFYCCLYHYEEPENLLSSPAALRKQYQLTEKQYVWTAIRARARLRQWTDIEQLLTTKSFFGGTKLKSVIGFDKVAEIVHKAEAPQEVTSKYLKEIDDIDRRLALAQKMQCHEAAVDTYLQQRDRVALQQYQKKLKVHSKEWFYAKDVLSNNSTKWKT